MFGQVEQRACVGNEPCTHQLPHHGGKVGGHCHHPEGGAGGGGGHFSWILLSHNAAA